MTMIRRIDSEKYYTSKEVCQKIGISRSTLWRWVQKDPSNDTRYRNRNGWRLWSDEQLEVIDMHFNTIYITEMSQ